MLHTLRLCAIFLTRMLHTLRLRVCLLSTKPHPPGPGPIDSAALVYVCVPFIINQTPAAGEDHVTAPQQAALSGPWAISSTESGPQPLLVTYNLSSLALTPREPTPYVCMYVSMVCGMYVGAYAKHCKCSRFVLVHISLP
jgi:hypothetical protein